MHKLGNLPLLDLAHPSKATDYPEALSVLTQHLWLVRFGPTNGPCSNEEVTVREGNEERPGPSRATRHGSNYQRAVDAGFAVMLQEEIIALGLERELPTAGVMANVAAACTEYAALADSQQMGLLGLAKAGDMACTGSDRESREAREAYAADVVTAARLGLRLPPVDMLLYSQDGGACTWQELFDDESRAGVPHYSHTRALRNCYIKKL